MKKPCALTLLFLILPLTVFAQRQSRGQGNNSATIQGIEVLPIVKTKTQIV